MNASEAEATTDGLTAVGLAELAGIGAIFGYVSLRAHLNTLDISASTSLGAERYLAEMYLLVMNVFFGPTLFVLALWLGKLALWRSAPAAPDCGAGQAAAVESMHRLFKSGFLILAAFCVSRVFLLAGIQGRVIGTIQPGAGPFWKLAAWVWLYAVLALIAWCFAAARQRCKMPGPPDLPGSHQVRHRSLRLTVLLAAGVLLLHVPLLYGRVLHNLTYNWVKVHPHAGSQQQNEVCGLLVLETTTDIHVWYARKGVGRIQAFARGDGEPVRVQGHGADLLEIARQAAERQWDIGSCKDLPEGVNEELGVTK